MKTRLYRVALVAVNVAAAVLLVVEQSSGDLGISTETLGLITAVANIIIVAARQLLDASTPSLPTTPAQPPAGPGAGG